jgi:hypothetical protein
MVSSPRSSAKTPPSTAHGHRSSHPVLVVVLYRLWKGIFLPKCSEWAEEAAVNKFCLERMTSSVLPNVHDKSKKKGCEMHPKPLQEDVVK